MRCEKAREVKATLLSGDKIVLTDRRVFPVSIGGLLVRSMASASDRSGFRAECRTYYSGTFATLDEDAVDPVGVHVDDLERQPAALEGLGDAWNMAELGDDQPGQRVEVAFGKAGEAEKVAELVEGHAAVQEPRSVGALHGVRLLLALGLHRHVADNRLENVAQGHQPQDGPEFIEDHGDSAG